MRRSNRNPLFHRFAIVVALLTLGLIGVGGLVTSKGAGMTVPDWPTTYGYNMFFFPISHWVGGVFWEHSHRLFASLVGLLMIFLAVWAQVRDSRPWFRRLVWIALAAVILQGVLGGLRVVWNTDSIGIFHAALAQSFLLLVVFLCFASSGAWFRRGDESSPRALSRLRRFAFALVGLLFVQLILGATMRHQHAGLAVPDFPLAYGSIYPDTSAAALEAINFDRTEVQEISPVTEFQIHLHMAHRAGAIAILIAAVALLRMAHRMDGVAPGYRNAVWGWFAIICAQATLGAWTVIANKPADVATLHVVFGALSLALIFLIGASASRQLALCSPNAVDAFSEVGETGDLGAKEVFA